MIITATAPMAELAGRGMLKSSEGPRDSGVYAWPRKQIVSLLKWMKWRMAFRARTTVWDCDKDAIWALNYANQEFADFAAKFQMSDCGHSFWYCTFGIAIGCESEYWKQFGVTGELPLITKPQVHAANLLRCDDGSWFIVEARLAALAPLENFLNEETELGRIITRLRFVLW